MTDTTERKLAITTTELRRLSQLNQEPDLASASYRCEEAVSIASDALARIAAEDAPPAPDLAEIGATEYIKAVGEDPLLVRAYPLGTTIVSHGPLLRAYAAMKAADPSCDPRVNELLEAAKEAARVTHPLNCCCRFRA